jgi:hypothetical protein
MAKRLSNAQFMKLAGFERSSESKGIIDEEGCIESFRKVPAYERDGYTIIAEDLEKVRRISLDEIPRLLASSSYDMFQRYIRFTNEFWAERCLRPILLKRLEVEDEYRSGTKARL